MPPAYWISRLRDLDDATGENLCSTEVLTKVIQEIQTDAATVALLKVERFIVDQLNFK